MEKICTNEKEIHEVLKNADKYLQKHGLVSLILMVDSKRCESLVTMTKNVRSMDIDQLTNYALAIQNIFKMIDDEITRRVKDGLDC